MDDLSLRGQRRNLRDLAYDSLRDAIIRARLEPGGAITEEQLASGLGVSRPIVREAVQRLVTEGLIERASNGRMCVSPATADDARAHYAVRTALELLAVEEAAHRMTPEGMAQLEAALGHMRTARDRRGEETVAEGGKEFHEILADIAGNPVNISLMKLIKTRIDRYRYLSVATSDKRSPQSVDEHEQVLSALRAGDVHAAKEAMRRHIAGSEESVLRALE